MAVVCEAVDRDDRANANALSNIRRRFRVLAVGVNRIIDGRVCRLVVRRVVTAPVAVVRIAAGVAVVCARPPGNSQAETPSWPIKSAIGVAAAKPESGSIPNPAASVATHTYRSANASACVAARAAPNRAPAKTTAAPNRTAPAAAPDSAATTTTGSATSSVSGRKR